MRVSFTITGKPLGWQRTGKNRKTGAIYTQEQTRQQEQLIAWTYRQQYGNFRFPAKTYIDIRVVAYYQIPKSTSKSKYEKMIAGEIRPTVKPDWDNIGKLVADALNGVAYDDDKCIVDAMVRKFYSNNPRTIIILQEAKRI